MTIRDCNLGTRPGGALPKSCPCLVSHPSPSCAPTPAMAPDRSVSGSESSLGLGSSSGRTGAEKVGRRQEHLRCDQGVGTCMKVWAWRPWPGI